MRIHSSKSLARIVGISVAAALSVSFAHAATYQFDEISVQDCVLSREEFVTMGDTAGN